MVVKQCFISGMKSEDEVTSYKAFIMFNVSFIGTCVKRDYTSKLTSRSVGRNMSDFFDLLHEIR